MSCCQREGIAEQFGRRTAAWDLRRFRKRGPTSTTRLLIDMLRTAGVRDSSILDIGGGVGAIYHELLSSGARAAVHVDISTDYLSAAHEEAMRRGHAERVELVHADFVEAAPTLGESDVVTLDRVICCYPDMDRLVGLAAGKARRLFGAVYPRQAWWMRAAVTTVNAVSRIRRSAFRTYLHPPAAIDARLRAQGLERRAFRRTLGWEVAVYARALSRPA